MSLYIPGTNPIRRLKLYISNFPRTLENIKTKKENKRKNLVYEDIISIEYECYETPECILESACIDKSTHSNSSFQEIIKVLKENKALKWKRYYFANFDYYDGTDWKFKLTFKNGETFISSGDIIFPKSFENVYKVMKDYITISDEPYYYGDYCEVIPIDEWYKVDIK